jgi:hypothetical protein
MFHLFVPSETEKKSWKEWEKKNADLIFLSHIQEPLEDTTEIFNEEKINTYAFKEGDLVKYGETVGRVVSGDGSNYKVKTSEGNNTMIKIEEIFITTESEQQLQIEKKLSILQAKIDEKKDELEKINLLVQIEITRNKLQDAEDAYQNSKWDTGNKLWNARSNILMRLRVILPDAPRVVKQDYLGDDELDEDATIKVLLEFKVNVLQKVKDEQRAAKYSLSQLKRQLTPQEQYLNTLKGVKTMAQQNKLLLEYEGDHPILWTWRKCYDLTFDNMKWKKRPGEVREEKKLLNEYFQKSFEKNKVFYEQYNSGTTDKVNALFIKVSKQMETKRMRIMDQITAANDEVGFIINCLEHFALFQFCELYQRKLREIKMLEKYTGETEKNN